MVRMSGDRFGEEGLGDLARRQLEAAERDPRLDREMGSPTADFFDAVDDVLRFRITAQGGAQALAHGSVEGGDVGARQASWERIELGRAEILGDFGWLNAATLVSLHGAVDALVEGIGPAYQRLRARVASLEIVRKGLRDHPELAAEISDDMRRHIADALADVVLEELKFPKPRRNGLHRWEDALVEGGLGLPPDRAAPADLDRALTEGCVLRDVLVHRGGRVDQKAANDCSTLAFGVGDFVRLGSARTRELASALIAYGTDAAHRSLAKVGLRSEPLELSTWRQYAPFV